MIPSLPTPSRILIAEDTPEIAYLMRRTLEYAGYTVENATNGESCLELAQRHQPDLLLLDLMMPKMHGIEVLKALREDPATEKIGVIVCTAKDFKTERLECKELGVADLLIKPFEAPELLGKVEAYFAKRGRAAAALGAPDAPPSTTFTRHDAASAAPEAEAEIVPVFAPKLEASRGSFSLWGTRGSTPVPGARFLRHGGNTSCMAVSAGDDYFIFDAGSGLRELGFDLLTRPARRLHLFITHTHWDHIQGFPFFAPAYVPGFEITIYGAEGFGKDLKSLFRGQLDRDYFPVQMEDMNAQIQFRHLVDNPVIIGDARIHWEFAQHPGATVGYKIEVGGTRIAWVPDNEFLQGYLGDPAALTRDDRLVAPFGKMIEFLSDADVVIHEAQYTSEEYPQKVRWGHSSVANAALLMKLAAVRRWIIVHHDPMHDDAFLENKLSLTRQILTRLGHTCQVTHGYDGLTEYF